MMKLMYVLVQRAPMKCSMGPIMEHVFEDEKECNLCSHLPRGSEGNLVCGHAKVLANRVEDKDQGEFAKEVGQENDFQAVPIFFVRRQLGFLNLPSLKVRELIHDPEWERSTKVHQLVPHKTQDPSPDEWVRCPNVVRRPLSLHPRNAGKVDMTVKRVLRSRLVHNLQLGSNVRKVRVHHVHECRGSHLGGCSDGRTGYDRFIE